MKDKKWQYYIVARQRKYDVENTVIDVLKPKYAYHKTNSIQKLISKRGGLSQDRFFCFLWHKFLTNDTTTPVLIGSPS